MGSTQAIREEPQTFTLISIECDSCRNNYRHYYPITNFNMSTPKTVKHFTIDDDSFTATDTGLFLIITENENIRMYINNSLFPHEMFPKTYLIQKGAKITFHIKQETIDASRLIGLRFTIVFTPL